MVDPPIPDPDAQILFVEPEEVAGIQRRQGAIGFDAPNALYPHRDELGRCSFEQLVEERLAYDGALSRLARIVHGADFPDELDTTRESAGLWAISQGFTQCARDDAEILERASFLYDSLYAHLLRQVARDRRLPDWRGRRPLAGRRGRRRLHQRATGERERRAEGFWRNSALASSSPG